MRWCKDRARQEYSYYLTHGGEEEARRNAIASIVSDLSKHPETANLQQTAVVLSMTVKDKASLDRFIDGFTE